MKFNPPSANEVAASAAAILSGENLFAGIKNSYGNYNGLTAIPLGLVETSCFENAKTWAACRKLGIPYLQILCGFMGSRRHGFTPNFNGALIRATDWDKLMRELSREFAESRAADEAWERVMAEKAADRSFDPENERLYA